MDVTPSSTGIKEFQVVGISRSGRVRKKSSKLLDFESPEEFEKKKRANRQTSRQYNGRGRPSNATRVRELRHAFEETLHSATGLGDFTDNLDYTSTPLAAAALSTTTQRLLPPTAPVIENSDDELDNLVADLVEGVEAECSTHDSKVRQSLYMREKSNKRKILKDGTVVLGKMQRKDKGKSRFTAYSLWAREVRKRDFQDLDFANAARRLSELWANVSNKEKNAWRRKAKIQATKARAREKSTPLIAAPIPANNNSQTVISMGNGHGNLPATYNSRVTTNRTKKTATAAAAGAAATDRREPLSNFVEQTVLPRHRRNATKRNRTTTLNDGQRGAKAYGADNNQGTGHKRGMGSVAAAANAAYADDPGKPSIEAVDAAAHLKLLGESLTIIGERLKEHDGQIALSGSLSVLLDSLLCSLGPLLCMTKQIPGLENKPQLNINLADTLDNIAYVMPGL